MATKTVALSNIGTINLYKRKGNRSIRLSFGSDGSVRVSLPHWVPYQAGIEFARAREQWISQHRPNPTTLLLDGDRIGKAHTLRYIHSPGIPSPRTRLHQQTIWIKLPLGVDQFNASAQAAAEKGAKKALQIEAEKLLPQRLEFFAKEHDFTYKSVSVKQLKSRWGSCNNLHDITLNYYLMQLPWRLIDYVLLHELTHTKALHHGPQFWQIFENVMPSARTIKKELKPFQTAVVPHRTTYASGT